MTPEHKWVDIVARIPAVPAILDVVCRTTGMGFAAVARITDDQWIACSVLDRIQFGLPPGGELKVETTICQEVRDNREAVVIDDVATDAAYCGHPTPAMYGFQSYISVPIFLVDGAFFGTLCAIDPKPAKLRTPEVVGTFKLFAELIAFHLDAQTHLAQSASLLKDERAIAELREQFIGILGHDLRNPLSAVRSGAHVLQRLPLGEQGQRAAAIIQGSAIRMTRLIDNLLDFASARLGGGLEIDRSAHEPLQSVLEQVVAEIRATATQRTIVTDFVLSEPVTCDTGRIGQLFSNLLGNAVTHGSDAAPVRVRAVSRDGVFELFVVNASETIAPDVMAQLFQPFRRREGRSGQSGVGLGLFIASQIAHAHGGTLEGVSNAGETRFTFRMPNGSAESATP